MICLNQTFEGLKFDKILHVLFHFFTFESDLWGIEIFYTSQVRLPQSWFESDLWGIEIRYWNCERKWFCRFESDLWGIEMKRT